MLPTDFLEKLLANAKAAGLKPRNLILIVLAVLCFSAMAAGVQTRDALLVTVTLYCLDPLLKFVDSWRSKRNSRASRDVVATDFQHHLQRKRKELRAQEPELPLSLPERDSEHE
jgi:hypothetical protein